MRRLFAVTAALVSLAPLVACSSSPTAPAEESAQGAEKLVSYWRSMAFDFCNWDRHPDQSVCHLDPSFPVSPSEPECHLDANGRPDFSDDPPPPGALFPDIGVAFGIDPGSTCADTPQTYPDGAQIFGGSALCGILRDHNTYEQLGPVRFTKSASQVVARMTGVYDNVQTGDIHVSAAFGFYDSPPGSSDDTLVLDVQTLDGASQWVSQSALIMPRGSTGVQDLAVRMAPNTPFRVEIHTGNYQGSRTIRLDRMQVLVPECIPDASNPGQCL